MPAPILSALDYLIIGCYLAGTLYLGLRLAGTQRTGKDFFLAGRTLPWWAVGASLVATDIGGTDVIGVGGLAYTHGLAVANFEWIGCVPAMVVAAYVFVPHFWRCGVATIPELLERRFDVRVRTAVAACWLAFMACNVGVMLFASAIMMRGLFGWEPWFSITLVAAAVGVYTFSGGLAAVVYTDVLQCVVMIAGCLLVLVVGVIDVGGFAPLWEAVQESGAARTTLVRAVDDPSPFPWPAILFGLGLILGPSYWIGNQAIVQRSLGTPSAYEAQASYLFGALLKNLIPVIVAVPGLIAMVKFPNLPTSDEAFPTLAAQLLPVGLRGIFLSAFLAALMSTIDSYLNSAATMVTYDVYKRLLRPDASEERLLAVGRTATWSLMLGGVAFAFVVANLQQGVYTIFQTLMSFFQGPALAVLLLGLFWRRANATGAFAGFLIGVATAVSLFTLNHAHVAAWLGWPPLFQITEAYLYYSFWAFATTLATTTLVSVCGSPDAAEKRALVITRGAPSNAPGEARRSRSRREPEMAPLSPAARAAVVAAAAIALATAYVAFASGSASAASPLHALGDGLRSRLAGVPLPTAKALFVALPAALMLWTWLQPRERTRPLNSPDRWSADLRVWSTLALGVQIAIYAWLG